MRFEEELREGRLVRRYQRFFADVELPGGTLLTVHCPNPGSMLGLLREGARVVVSRSKRPGRKLTHTWELVRVGKTWVGINTLRSNAVVEEALRAGRVPELDGFLALRREVAHASGRRLDFCLEGRRSRCFVEVKNVTLARGRIACFPDSVTARGTAHLRALAQLREAGQRAVLLFLVARQDCVAVEPAADLDPVYADALGEARGRGVEVLAYAARVGKRGIRLERRLPFRMPLSRCAPTAAAPSRSRSGSRP